MASKNSAHGGRNGPSGGGKATVAEGRGAQENLILWKSTVEQESVTPYMESK